MNRRIKKAIILIACCIGFVWAAMTPSYGGGIAMLVGLAGLLTWVGIDVYDEMKRENRLSNNRSNVSPSTSKYPPLPIKGLDNPDMISDLYGKDAADNFKRDGWL